MVKTQQNKLKTKTKNKLKTAKQNKTHLHTHTQNRTRGEYIQDIVHQISLKRLLLMQVFQRLVANNSHATRVARTKD